MNFRTDLALEDRETDKDLPSNATVRIEHHDGCTVTAIEVLPEEVGFYRKPPGQYITIELPAMTDSIDREDRFLTLVAKELWQLLPEKGMVLAAGLGNRAITPDALGPRTADQILATRHITGELERLTGETQLRSVVSVSPNVLGNTGLEAVELLESLTGKLKPAAILVIDALAARKLSRLGCTVQLSNAGIAPGSGVGNSRPAISRETLGVPVIAIGVPTVVDAGTLALDLLEGKGIFFREEEVAPRGTAMIVTPREIDLLINRASRLVAMAVNTALNPVFDAETFAALL